MTKTYFDVTGQELSPNLREQLEYFDGDVSRFNKRVDRASDDEQRTDRALRAITSCMWGLTIRHFGFPYETPALAYCQKGLELAELYFNLVGPKILAAAPKVEWYTVSLRSFLLASLSNQHEVRTQFADYLVPQLQVEPMAIPEEPLHGDLLLVIASSMRSEPMNVTQQLTQLGNSRKKRPKLLLQAFHALQNDDQAKFTQSIIASTDRFVNSSACENNVLLDATAKLESVLVGLAWEKGWQDLDFPFETAARLITHRSIGIAP
ncbi:hypothetical protein [Blastopirellula retiformator]|uniref:Uncharacterized protein n=1 Tax=Blastopirellula retiformator TaxID=2527970 RepID=A0A5C5V113_9BACT|nr:hypothetical protein [Blastopirellula retiformator]TWT32081.1 hypothetical protein Enr8_40070 [Blastopirellula retiformator]